MSTPTTTIRVPVETRDRLAVQARGRGMSLAALLTELATRTEHEAMLRAERADATAHAVHDEEIDWDEAAADGVDGG